ncbi:MULTISPECIES: alcohol dehydrogenase catalytic domain-containing protein [Cryobacterium]|uniref:alcohol dehydrogenase catalytic domain-containing protein n=1 Tax=Cryobacterium TaxID=69578 RepID=UPI0018E0C2A4|nr:MULTISPECIES: alcohol dehydrogenase catalytic domain-containing protein [Cryobacterium]
MKAIVQRDYGDVEVLKVEDIDHPVVGQNDVLVRVVAASLNHADWIHMSGTPLVARLAFGTRRPKAMTRGKDVAGVVESVGTNVTAFRQGDEVYESSVQEPLRSTSPHPPPFWRESRSI